MKKYKAYSLLELTITLLVVGILLAGGSAVFTNVSKSQNMQQKQIVTLERSDKIYKAILNYLAQNYRLPCPARLDVAHNDVNNDYGKESRDSLGNCQNDDDTISGKSKFDFLGDSNTQNLGITGNNMRILYGMVPIQQLNLAKKDAEDGYGNKFSYVIVKEFGTKTTDNLDGFESYAGSERMGDLISDWDYINIIDKSSGSGVEITNKAIMLLISHGEKDDGAFRNSGGNPLPSSSDHEGDNSYKTSSSDKYDRNFNIDSSQASFDDFIIFKTKDQLIRDAKLEFIKCSGEQGFIHQNIYNTQISSANCLKNNIGLTDTFYSTHFDVDINDVLLPGFTNCKCQSDEANLRRTCGKYGKWTHIYCDEQYASLKEQIDELKKAIDDHINDTSVHN
jgi:type II secretory pathway pseudopilin PulG